MMNQSQKGFPNMIVSIAFLLVVGGAVLYFKNFPLAQTPVGSEPTREIQSTVLQTESLSGTDTDNNGVWDYIDGYIDTAYPKDEKLRAGLRQYARSIQNGILNAHNKNLSLQYAMESDRAQECIAFLRPNDFNAVLGGMEAQMLNTAMRTKEFLVWSEQSAGEVFPSAPISERDKSCVTE